MFRCDRDGWRVYKELQRAPTGTHTLFAFDTDPQTQEDDRGGDPSQRPLVKARQRSFPNAAFHPERAELERHLAS
jgi:hypothetical protein